MLRGVPDSVARRCLAILAAPHLDAKLRWLPRGLPKGPPTPPPAAPARGADLAMAGGADRLPRPAELTRAGARARCLARFAHHELMAVELFAWALLRWPDAPPPVRAGWLATLADEQRHCRMYLERLRAHGGRMADHAPHSDYFWHQLEAIAASPRGPAAFEAAMGLTLEQANLDFTLTYRDAFRAAGDEASARVCQAVHDDEVEHVRRAARGLARLEAGPDEVARYEAAVPFPLAANRAKGRRFDVPARRRAGLGDAFIEHVRRARSSQERAGRG